MATAQGGIRTPDLSLPKGGGAIRGLEPGVRTAGFRGTAQLTVSLPLPKARALTPELSLAYDSGAGNGLFGIGASVGIPSIGRSTALGVPTYTAADVMVFTEAGALVPKGAWSNGRWVPCEREVTDGQGVVWQVATFIPRDEAALALIEQWTRLDDRTSHWRVVSPDNVVSRFGVSASARISDPDDAARIFEWFIEDVADAKGNLATDTYKPDDDANVARPWLGQGAARPVNTYIERIRYGNYPTAEGATAYAFELVFDYGEYDLPELARPSVDPYGPVRSWPERLDPFSSYRSGFEIRTNRLCHGVLVFHNFPAELGPTPCLTRALRLDYAQTPFISNLSAVTQLGYRRAVDGSYGAEALPPVSLSFTGFDPPPAPEFRKLSVERAADLPGYLVPGAYQPVDLDGEGLPGFLQSNGAGTRYYAPLGEGRYAAPSTPASFPDCRDLGNPDLALVDLDANGRLELLASGETSSGYFRHFDDGSWAGLAPLEQIPTRQQSPNLELVDLSGDGRADLMQLTRSELQYYPSLGTQGYARQRSAGRQPDFPSAAATKGRELVTFAGIFGDGLSHRVRVTDGEVVVWPNLGHGRFGPKRLLAGAPAFPASLSTNRIYFADVDGTGTADLVVAETDRLLIYRNESGNGFSSPLAVPLPFRLGDNDQLSFADILGTGTTAIVATRVSPTVEHWFCDLATPRGGVGGKPYLLASTDNGFGGTTELTYASSTSYYLADKRAGTPWVTRLPFPVQLVAEITTADAVGGASSTTRFRYHDGYFDPSARAFRGFGYVESWQSQSYAPFEPSSQNPDWPVARVNADLQVAPVYAKTWYSTGAYFLSGELQRQNARAYFAGDPDAYRVPPSVFDPAILAAGGPILQQAYAALAGKVIHAELYAQDGDRDLAATPYTVSEADYAVILVQPAGPQGLAAFHVRDRESLLYTYEREASDPRVEHSFLLVSTLLDPGPAGTFYERRCTVEYGRRAGAPIVYPEQASLKASVEESWSTRVLAPFRMVGVPYERRSSEIGGLTLPAGGYFTFADIDRQVAAALANEIPYGRPLPAGVLAARLATHGRSYFWNEAQDAALGLGGITARALLHHEENATFSEAWRLDVFAAKASDADLADIVGLVADQNDYWWNPGLVLSYFGSDDPEQFFLLCASGSAAGAPGPYAKTTIGYDAPYALAMVEVADYVDAATALTSTGLYDYQALQLRQVTDPNGVVQQALYGPLGLVLVNSVFKPAGSGEPRIGDGDLADYVPRSNASFSSVLADKAHYLEDASSYFFYDLQAWQQTPAQPVSSISLTRTRFVSDGVADAPIEAAIVYSDGAGLAAQGLRECEPAPPPGARRGTRKRGKALVSADRWQVSGRTVYDAAGQPAQAYLPFYSASPLYQGQQALVDEALAEPPRITAYDPLGRAIEVDTPKGFLTRTVYGAWQTLDYDEDDTVLDPPFYRDFMAHYPAKPTQRQKDEKAALEKAVPFYNTPQTAILDNAGHTIRQIRNNLGNVPPTAFDAIVEGTNVTSQELWSALIAAGYLATLAVPAGTWVAPKFAPYTPGFALTLPPPYDQFAAAVTTLLTQNCLTSFFAVDLAGRVLEGIDPRLYLADIDEGTTDYNFRYFYPMGAAEAARTDSADAGTRWLLASVLGSPVIAWDAMGRRQQKSFDGLQRLTATLVTEVDGASRTSEVLAYGEGQPDAASANLLGQLYRLEDEAGVLLYPAYTILGQPAASSRQFAQDYKVPPNWSQTVMLDPGIYALAFTYDALRRPLAETMPDGSLVTFAYYVSGRLQSIDVAFPGASAEPFITAIAYGADDRRQLIAFGNGIVQTLAYEATTGRLLALAATRPATDGRGLPRDPQLQSVDYAYDPVGNLSIVRDRTAQLLFCGGTEPEALGDYTYDAIYELVAASGLQHPGIEASTHVTGFMQSLYAELCPTGAPPIALETYGESYAYDNSGNLITTRHVATSATFERDNPVMATTNRLAGVPYDANGNMLQTTLTAPVELVFDARNNFVRTGPLERPDGSYEHDYFVYDFFGERARRIVEASATPSGPITATREEILVGAYGLERVTDASGTTTTATLRVTGAGTCFVVSNTPSSGGREIRYQLDDRLASVSIEAGQDASILSYEAFFPFGGTSIIAGNDQAIVAQKQLRYSGKACDDGTGFYYYGARYYLPWQGRWLNPDPAGAADGMNLMQFVGGNPLTLIDSDGRGNDGPDAPKSSTDYNKVLQALLKSFMYAIYNAPQNAFVDAPTAIARRLSLDPVARAQARTEGRARLEETRLIYYNLFLAFGINPADYLPRSIDALVRPRTQPWSTTNIPFYGNPLQLELRDRVSQPSFVASQIGSFLGGFTTVGTSLAITHRLLLSAAPLPIKIFFTPLLVGQTLGVFGRGQEVERIYSQHLEEQKKLWFWQKAYKPDLSGIPRNLVFLDHQERQAQKLWEGFSVDQALLVAGSLLVFRFFGPKLAQGGWRWAAENWSRRSGGRGGGGGSPSTALTLWKPNTPTLSFATWQANRQALSAFILKITANLQSLPQFAAYFPQRAVVPYVRGATQIARYTPGTTALALWQAPVTALRSFFPSLAALTSFFPSSTAVALVAPRSTALTLYRPPVTALTLFQNPQRALALLNINASQLTQLLLKSVKK